MNKETHKIVAFIFMFKRHRRNSMLYCGETVNSFIKTTGINISHATFRKYWNKIVKLGLVKDEGTHKMIIGWDECLRKLDVPYQKRRINKLLFKVKGKTFNAALTLVEEALVLLKLLDQEYKAGKADEQAYVLKCILSGKHIGGRSNMKMVKRLAKQSRSLGQPLEVLAARMLNDLNTKVVTGSYHLEKYLGISRTKCNQILNSLSKRGAIERKIVKEELFKGEANHRTFDIVKGAYPGTPFYYSPSRKSFILTRGSELAAPICISKF